MRQLLIHTPRGSAERVRAIADAYDPINVVQFEGRDQQGPVDLTLVHVSNYHLGRLLDDLDTLDGVHISFMPAGVIALKPPPSDAPAQVRDVQPKSPLEVLLEGFQSIGSWKSFLCYAALAGVVVWIGLFTNTTYLLTAAMLIAPFAGPAMNAALGTASGEVPLLRQNLGRYAAALAVSIGTACLLSLVFGQQTATAQMISRSKVSQVAVLLPLAAGAAGALHLSQSERNSLVSGAAVGMLVAASLAPPAGVLGMAAAIGRWDMARSTAFVLLLQLVGINLSGALVFRLYGLSAAHARFGTGRRWLFPAGTAATLLMLAALLTWQFTTPVMLEQASLEQAITRRIERIVEASQEAVPVEVDTRFTRADIPGQETLLSDVYVQRRPGAERPDDALRQHLGERIQQELRQAWPHVTPLVSVHVLAPPDSGGRTPGP